MATNSHVWWELLNVSWGELVLTNQSVKKKTGKKWSKCREGGVVIKESLGAVFLTSAADQQTGEQTLKNKAQQFFTPQLGE